jgi:hypothetical protein
LRTVRSAFPAAPPRSRENFRRINESFSMATHRCRQRLTHRHATGDGMAYTLAEAAEACGITMRGAIRRSGLQWPIARAGLGGDGDGAPSPKQRRGRDPSVTQAAPRILRCGRARRSNYAWLAAAIGAWALCYARGYRIAAWVAPLTISAFCLGLYIGVQTTAMGRFRLPVGVVAHQAGMLWEDSCGGGEASSEGCMYLRDLMKPARKP